jgi:ribokinase
MGRAYGAGDCFVGAVAAQLAAGKFVHAALHFANAAASISVQRMHRAVDADGGGG